MVTMRLKYDVSILVCHVRCPSLPSCSVVNDSSPLVYYWSTSCMDDLCCVFLVYSNVVLWLAVCPRTFLIRGQTTTDVIIIGKYDTHRKMMPTGLFGDHLTVTSNALDVAESASRSTRRHRASQTRDGCSRHGVRQQTHAPRGPVPRVRPAVNHRTVAPLKFFEVWTVRGWRSCGLRVLHRHSDRVRNSWSRMPHDGSIPSSTGRTTTSL